MAEGSLSTRQDVMGPATADLPPGLAALRHDIATAEHPITAQRWLTKQPIVTVLSDLAAGRMPLTHEAFDELPKCLPVGPVVRQGLAGHQDSPAG